jgi:4-amino-4-deoxychorismate lyase
VERTARWCSGASDGLRPAAPHPNVILVDGQANESIHALDRGLAYGDGVFRTMRARAGVLQLWPEHYRKLRADCARIGIECPGERELLDDIERLLGVEGDCIVKLIVTRGQGGRGYAVPQRAFPTRIAASFPSPPPPADCDQRGVRVRWCATRLADQPALAGVKHLNRLENVLARSEWTDAAIAEGLMCDAQGDVIEGTTSNLFVLERGRLVTPPLQRCGVEGVQRARLIALAPRLCAGCEVTSITPPRLLAADQVYLTNSVIGAWWVSALDERTWARCDPTPALLAALCA